MPADWGWLIRASFAKWPPRVCRWLLATTFLAFIRRNLLRAPNLRRRRWYCLTPGAAIGTGEWLIASLGFRTYLHFFHSFTFAYGSLGAVIILLVWFYITGLMLLLGAEINIEIEAAATEAKLAAVSHPSSRRALIHRMAGAISSQ
jgi:membrane protein